MDVKGWSNAQCETGNEDKRGQDSLGPGVTHSQGDMAHYDSLLPVGWEHERQNAGRGGAVGRGWGSVWRWCVWRGKDSSLQMGGKRAISNQVPSAAQFATGQNTSVIRFHVTIYPKSACTVPSIGSRHENKGESLRGSSCHSSALSPNFKPA